MEQDREKMRETIRRINAGEPVEVYNSQTASWDALGWCEETKHFDVGIWEAIKREGQNNVKFRILESSHD